jgi:hypothetical protein
MSQIVSSTRLRGTLQRGTLRRGIAGGGRGGAGLGLVAVLAACQASLGLGDYEFMGGAGGGGAGSSGASGTAGASNGGSASGASGSGGGTSGSGGDAGGSTGGTPNLMPDSGAPACDTEGLAELVAPVLAGPVRGVYTGSLHADASQATLRPRLAWREVTSQCPGVTYQLQLDDSCAPGALDGCEFASPELDVATLEATSFQPEQDLPVSSVAPVGALYAWRVRACDSGERCSERSEVRHLFVGRVPQDVNGDGFAEVVVQHSGGPSVFVGSVQFDQTADHTLVGSGSPSVFLGDVNGDGFADIGATIGSAETTGLVPRVLFGGPDIDALTGVSLTASPGTPSTNTIIRAAGDINGDGFSDLIVHLNNRGLTDIYFGGTTLAATPDLPLSTPLDELNATPGSGSAGDVNGDGFQDALLVVSPALDAAQLLLGGPNPSATLSAPIPFGLPCTFTDIIVSGGGDVNGDGFDDVFVSCSATGVFAYFGAAEPGTSWFSTRQPDAAVLAVASHFDIDEDGLDDVLVGLDTGDPLLFLGNASSFSLQAPEPGAMTDLAGARMIAVADHNGDAHADFVVGGYDVNVQRANGDGTIDPRSVGSFIPAGDTMGIQGSVVY